jgi:hypothetical protein
LLDLETLALDMVLPRAECAVERSLQLAIIDLSA